MKGLHKITFTSLYGLFSLSLRVKQGAYFNTLFDMSPDIIILLQLQSNERLAFQKSIDIIDLIYHISTAIHFAHAYIFYLWHYKVQFTVL